jgi:hypothetical protein
MRWAVPRGQSRSRTSPEQGIEIEVDTMNHYRAEFLAKDHLAELRREASQPRSEPAIDATSRPTPVPRLAVRRLIARLVLVMQPSARHG